MQETVKIQSLDELLKEFIGDQDILLVDYKPIDESTIIEQVDLRLVRGSVRLASGNLQTPAEVSKIKTDFINKQLL